MYLAANRESLEIERGVGGTPGAFDGKVGGKRLPPVTCNVVVSWVGSLYSKQIATGVHYQERLTWVCKYQTPFFAGILTGSWFK